MRTVTLEEVREDEPLRRQLRAARRVVCVVGAGLSTSSGIPDFRSAGGLYEHVKNKYSVRNGADLFDANLFRRADSTKMFHEFVGKLYELTAKATPTDGHRFLSHLRDGRRLVRVYTQNIDGLEEEAGLRMYALDGTGAAAEGDVVQLHGDLRWLRCGLCHAKFPLAPHMASYKRGEPVPCPDCRRIAAERDRLGKRALGEGVLRSAIVLYNEEHPYGLALAHLAVKDMRRRPDCLIIMGTSLKVAGCKRLVRDLAKAVHSHPRGVVVFVNATDVSESEWANVIDVHVRAGIDEVARWLETAMPKVAPPKARTTLAAPDVDVDVDVDTEEWEDLPAGSSQVVPDVEGALDTGSAAAAATAAAPAYLMDLVPTPPASQELAGPSSSPRKPAAASATAPLTPRRSARATMASVPEVAPLTPRRSARAHGPAVPEAVVAAAAASVLPAPSASPPQQPPLSPRRSPRRAAEPPTTPTHAASTGAAAVSPSSSARKRMRSAAAASAAVKTPLVQRTLNFGAATATTTPSSTSKPRPEPTMSPAGAMRPLTQQFSQRKAGVVSPTKAATTPTAAAKSAASGARFKPPSPADRPAVPYVVSGTSPALPRTPKSLGLTRRPPTKKKL